MIGGSAGRSPDTLYFLLVFVLVLVLVLVLVMII